MPTNREPRVFDDVGALTEAAAQRFVDAATRAVAARGRFGVALAGGSTPRALYALLASRHGSDPWWDSTSIFFGDERCVTPDRPESNFRMAYEQLLVHLSTRTHVYRILGESAPPDAALSYETVLRGWGDALDLVLLGIGEDGHTASLFPGDPLLEDQDRLVSEVLAPPSYEVRARITITLPVIADAREVLVLATGESKAEAVRRSRAGDASLPLGRLSRDDLHWMLDREAASRLPSG